MATKRNSLIAGAAIMAAAMAFTGQFESPGAKPVLVAYRDQGGVPTICNGITKGVHMGMRVTREWCDARFEEELEIHSKPLDRVPYQMSQEARMAWSDFCFNVGTGACQGSGAFKTLMAGRERESCDGFLAWRFTSVRGVKRDCSLSGSGCAGIWARRNAERDLCQGRITEAGFMGAISNLGAGGVE
jgi:lysozyme